MDTTLILIGVGCIIGAIIGGGVKLVQLELSPVTSLWRQMLLGIFGIILVISGLVAGGQLRLTQAAGAPVGKAGGPANGDGPIAGSPVSAVDTGDRLSSGTRASTAKSASLPSSPPLAALPGKVDIFWCAAEEGGSAHQAAAEQILSALRASGRIGRVRSRPLSAQINAQPDYGIAGNVVRFDPGEQPAAAAIARIATDASGTSFEPAPALPGSPSIDYLSIFVCAP